MNLFNKITPTELLDFDKPIIYIAGKVTGLPYPQVYAKFKAKQLELESLGHQVINPCEHIAEDCAWDVAMRISLVLLCQSDFICLLPDWVQSKGATLERNWAAELNIPTVEE